MYFLFDIGGTHTRAATSPDGKKIVRSIVVPTPRRFERGMVLIRTIANRIAGDARIRLAAGGIAGPLDTKKSSLLAAPHLAGWVGKPIRNTISKIVRAPVTLENDAALAGLGEARRGAGKKASIVAYLTVGTGVGGARIVRGEIDARAIGFEPGHQLLQCVADRAPRSLESLVSGSALKAKYGREPRMISGFRMWRETAECLAYGVHNAIVLWSPDIVVLGGGMVMKRPGISIARVRASVKRLLTIFPSPPAIARAMLGDEAGLYGALILANRHAHL